jgi:prevent-host-death family protein
MGEINVGVRELKTRLSEYLQRVKAGQTLVITERGKPVGRIVPVQQSLEERLQGLIEAGLAEWNGKQFQPGEPVVVNRGDRQVAELVVEGREIDYLP